MGSDRFKDVPWGSYQDVEKKQEIQQPKKRPKKAATYLRMGDRIRRRVMQHEPS